MRSSRIVIGIAGLAFSAIAAQAQQPVCAKRDNLVKFLDTKYSEQPTGHGLAGSSAMMEVFTSEKGTFTILTTYPNGLSCIVAAGDNWEKLEFKKKLTSM